MVLSVMGSSILISRLFMSKMGHEHFKSSVFSVPGSGCYKPDEAWRRAVARNAGFYKYPNTDPEGDVSLFDEKSNDKFAALLKAENPKSACIPIMIEEHRCLVANDYRRDPETASSKCVKWYQEWLQCKWDEERLKFGYNYLEDRPSRKHKAYIAAPDYQYS